MYSYGQLYRGVQGIGYNGKPYHDPLGALVRGAFTEYPYEPAQVTAFQNMGQVLVSEEPGTPARPRIGIGRIAVFALLGFGVLRMLKRKPKRG